MENKEFSSGEMFENQTPNPGINEKLEKIQYEEIEGLQKPIESLVKQLDYDLKSGKYNLIIGEDASGRIPALIMKRVIDHIYKKNNHSIPEMRFVAGFKHDVSEGLDSYINEYLSRETKNQLEDKIGVLQKDFSKFKGKNALLITDYIFTGRSTDSIRKILRDIDIELDIATVKSDGPPSPYSYDTYTGSSDLTGGTEPSIYKKHHIGGVIKEEHEAPYASRYHRHSSTSEAREDVKKLADKIIEKYDKFEL